MASNLHGLADVRRRLVQPGSLRQKVVFCTEPETETITWIARDHVQVDVKDFLPGSLAVG
jgi:hypothetical protein